MISDEPLPVIPAQEYRQRWEQTQAMLERQGIDLLVAYADDRAVFGPAQARWLANFPARFEPACVLLPRRGEPVLLCGPESDEYARLIGHIADVRVLREFTHPDEDYPYSAIQGVAEIFGEIFGRAQSIGRVGLAGRALINADSLATFHKALPQALWIDAEEEFTALRAIKSPAEIAVIRYAYRIAEAGISAAVAAIQVGVTERDVAAAAEAAMRRAGAEGTGIDTIVASGPNSRPILARTTMREIQQNDLVLLTVAPRYEGYHAAIGRPVLVGRPPDPIPDAAEKAIQAQQACFQAMKPGIPGRDVEAIGRRIMETAGYGPCFLYSGLHSVGVIEFEPPIFGPSSTVELQPNMVISVDIPVFNAPWGGLRVEDGFLITADRAERLNTTPFQIAK